MLRTKLRAFVRRWLVKEAAAILSDHGREIRSKYDALHDRLKAERDAGWPGAAR